MPEILEGKRIFTLLEVSRGIQATIAKKFPESYWIKAEMNKLGFYAQSGHCFPELVEKKEGRIIARLDGLIWKTEYQNIDRNFRKVLGDGLKDGIKILFLARVEFMPEFGLKLRIIDIDPAFTLGDFEKERQETIKRLQKEGIFDKNKSLMFPMLPKRIAIISDRDSRGYQDFISVFEAAKNNWGYNFFHMLFTASLQGEKALATIPFQLDRILKVRQHFDLVAIIRGGGGELTFACYNNFELSKKIATYPLPVVTGIGHVTNMTVVDMVANQSSITPTKLAEFFIQKFHNFSVPVKEAQDIIRDQSRRLMSETRSRFNSEIKLFRSATVNLLSRNKNTLRENTQIIRKDTLSNLRQLRQQVSQHAVQIKNGCKVVIKSRKTDLAAIGKNIDNMSPKNVMKRGYSITLLNGKSVTASADLKPGDKIQTVLHDGNVLSTVNSASKLPDQ
jgi:exodeoxyribonuclease VII large subunit